MTIPGIGRFAGVLAAIAVFCFTSILPANAHRQGESYIYLNVTENTLSGRLEVTLEDIARLPELYEGQPNPITKAYVDENVDNIAGYFQPKLYFVIAGKELPIQFKGHSYFDTGFGSFIKLEFSTEWKGELPDSILVRHSSSIQNLQPAHQTFLVIESNTKTGLSGNEAGYSLIFNAGKDEQELSLLSPPKLQIFQTFLYQGIVHILIGLDHIAFLFALLLASVLVRQSAGWQPVESFQQAFINVIKIVTLFTIAHSITLSLSAVGWVNLPSQPVEVLIAASVLFAALSNLFAFRERYILIAIFALGLLHGLGFASVLAPLGVAQSSLLISLLAFNIGVEVGQAAIVAVCFPILFLLRKYWFYVPVILKGGSLIIAAIALIWVLERMFDFNIPLQRLFS